MKALLLVSGCLLLCGCASTPVGDDEAHDVAQDRIAAPQFTQQRPNTVRLTVKRDRGFTGGACASKLYVDGSLAAEVKTSEKIALFLAPGKHLLGVKPSGICAGGTAEAAVVLEANAPQSYRISVEQSGDLRLQPTAF